MHSSIQVLRSEHASTVAIEQGRNVKCRSQCYDYSIKSKTKTLANDYHGGDVSITVEDALRIKIIGEDDPNFSWLRDDQVTLPIVLAAVTTNGQTFAFSVHQWY
jgi:hypothetical protein